MSTSVEPPPWPEVCEGLEYLSLQEIESDILQAEERLRAVFPEQSMRSLCYPSYMSYAGSGATRQGYAPIVARHFPAVRGLGEFADKPFTCELHYLHNWDAARRSGAELVGPAERSLAQGRWRIPAFHGLEDTHLPMALSDFRELLAHLFGHRHRIWTVPIIAVAQRITGMAGRQVDIRPTTRNQQEGANNGYGLTVGRPSRPD